MPYDPKSAALTALALLSPMAWPLAIGTCLTCFLLLWLVYSHSWAWLLLAVPAGYIAFRSVKWLRWVIRHS